MTSSSSTPQWYADLASTADRLEPEWIRLRRHLHQHPELSGREYETTRFLAETVDRIGIPPHIVGTVRHATTSDGDAVPGRGLIVDFVSAPEMADRKRFAIRGDIDALPITDGKSVDYRSHHDGVMHACGHDVHASVIVGALQILLQMHRSGKLPHPVAVRGIFQPAEETAEGARYMIALHALQDVDAILALHVDPTRAVGRIGLREGPFTAACDIFEVRFKGRGGHGARPHLCHDPIDAATLWVQSAYRCLSRVVDPHETVVISVGQMEAGHQANVIPERAMLRGSLRSLHPDARSVALEKLHDVGESVSRQTGCEVTLELVMSAPGVINDVDMVRRLRRVASHAIDPAVSESIALPSMGSEDFSFYLEQHPGAMFRLGIAGPQVGHEPLHTPNFDVDERAIAVGAKLMAAMAIDYFTPDDTTEPDTGDFAHGDV
ncbi:M20 metallopeptidase family protein [Neorhodopirellula pilleata]|uniref:Putative hydrolase YxeP n=1 Tax=Neorhodopirellula pilleata TaxID=2714738 RepID=A0A5C5ZR59_9BACT|nr:amidohydrolase [Neorhodopirellula pilleata]TWT89555.1 putative hydrolase YxeP [Neorhodopirellula pilleata]